MAIFTYLDVSGTEDLPAMGVAGLIAHEDQWCGFNRDWSETLSREGIREFHMKEFAHSTGEFTSWKRDEPRRVAFISKIKEIILRWTTHSVGVSIFVEEYKRVDQEFELRELFGGPYSLATFLAVLYSWSWKEENHPGEELVCFVEEGDNFQSELFDALNRIDFGPKAQVTRLKKRWTDGGSTKYCLPFQACDFIAYEIGKAARTAFENDAEEIVGRKSFLGLLPRERDRHWRYIDEYCLARLCRNFNVPRRSK